MQAQSAEPHVQEFDAGKRAAAVLGRAARRASVGLDGLRQDDRARLDVEKVQRPEGVAHNHHAPVGAPHRQLGDTVFFAYRDPPSLPPVAASVERPCLRCTSERSTDRAWRWRRGCAPTRPGCGPASQRGRSTHGVLAPPRTAAPRPSRCAQSSASAAREQRESSASAGGNRA